MTTALSDAGVQFASGNIVDMRSTVPTTGTYTAGDTVLEATSGPRISGWKRITTGSNHVVGTDWVYLPGLTPSTAVASTSGASIDFTGIPSSANRITMMLNGVSTTGTNSLILQIGSGSIDATGYAGAYAYLPNASGIQGSTYSTSFVLLVNIAAVSLIHGQITLLRVSGNIWSFACNTSLAGAAVSFVGSGTKSLSGALDRVRLTTVGGTDTFDAGSVNIIYE